jgi:hypothetical protein
MPFGYRLTLKRQLTRALKSLNYAQEAVIKVGHEYKEKYPDIYEGYCLVVALIDKVKELVETLITKI